MPIPSYGVEPKKQPKVVGFYDSGGVEEDRTPDLRIANATLSQLSYDPNGKIISPDTGVSRLGISIRLYRSDHWGVI